MARFINIHFSLRYDIAPSQAVEAIIHIGAERRCGPIDQQPNLASSA